MTTRAFLLLLGVLLLAPACFQSEPDLARSNFACVADDQCLDGYVCRLHAEGKYCTPYTEAVFDDIAEPDASSPDVATDEAAPGADVLPE